MNKKRSIVLASLLKPVDDTRMYEKLALSMAQTNKYAINIIGFYSKNIPQHPSISFYPLFRFKRLSLKRLLAPLKFGRFLLKVKPDLIIATSPDLLIVSCAYKILFGSKVIYDVQENYKQNIIWSSNLPPGLRYLTAFMVRGIEKLLKRMIIHFFLAELCYVNECSFIEDRFTILENKARFPSSKALSTAFPVRKKEVLHPTSSEPVRFIYSGTIAESYGIFDCIHLIDQWASKGQKVLLTIIGYCPRQDTLQELLLRIKDKAYIKLIGGDTLIPHQQILQELQKAHFSLISYRLNPSNQDCFPTRVWECLVYKIPMIFKPEHPWVSLIEEYGAGQIIDYRNPPPQVPYSPEGYYHTKPIPPTFYWEHEEKKLLECLEKLF